MEGTLAKRPQIIHRRGSFPHSQQVIPVTKSRADEYDSESDDTESDYSLSKTVDHGTHNFAISNVSPTSPSIYTNVSRFFTLPKPEPISPLIVKLPSLMTTGASPEPPFHTKNQSPFDHSSRPHTPKKPQIPRFKLGSPTSAGRVGRDQPVPRLKGWDEFRSPRESVDLNCDRKASQATMWPTNITDRGEGRDNRGGPRYSSLGAEPAAITGHKGPVLTKKSSEIEAISSFYDLRKKLKVVYTQGPQGEGQKMWNGIYQMRVGKRELKQAQARLARAKAQEEQLDAMHETALSMPVPKPLTISPPIPRRPSPLGFSRLEANPEPVKPPPEKVMTDSHWRTDSKRDKASSLMSLPSTLEVPIKISQSVSYDAKESVLDVSKNRDQVPKLDPAPRSRSEAKRKDGLLPPPPVLQPGETTPVEVAQQEKMKKMRAGALPTLPYKPLPKSVGQTISSIASQKPMVQFKHKEKEISRFAQAFSNFFDAPPDRNYSRRPAADHILSTKKQEKHAELKKKISVPKLITVPHNFSIDHISERDEPRQHGASVGVPPSRPNGMRVSFSGHRTSFSGKGKAKRAVTPPLLTPPSPCTVPIEARAQDRKYNTYPKPKPARPWRGLLTSPIGGSFFKRQRADSDTSLVSKDCWTYEQQQLRKANELMVFRGPVRQLSSQQVRDLGPSKQTMGHEFIDDSAVPEPLFSLSKVKNRGAGRIRNTRFYNPVHDVIDEYI